MTSLHLDQAYNSAVEILSTFLQEKIEKAVLIHDLYGKIRIAVWISSENAEEIIQDLDMQLFNKCSDFWTRTIWNSYSNDQSIRSLCDLAWNEGVPFEGLANFRISNRYRSRGGWFTKKDPIWNLNPDIPPVVVFYSFKGGVGRTTSLASFAIQRAREGERVAVIDLDLDAPGIGSLFTPDGDIENNWGVVDYILEYGEGLPSSIQNYGYICRRSPLTAREGEILIIPAGNLNTNYLKKLSKIDFDTDMGDKDIHPINTLLSQIRDEWKPDWILVDARAGLSEAAGFLLNGIAHNYVLFGLSSDQSWRGISCIIELMGKDRILSDLPQSEIILVQAMIPENPETAKRVKLLFKERSEEVFEDLYYAEDSDGQTDDRFWFLQDKTNPNPPHDPITISYSQRIAEATSIDDIADALCERPYTELNELIHIRLGRYQRQI